MKMPLLAGVSTQNSALISKSVYGCLVTRYPPMPLSAWSTPSAIVQFASPTLLNASMFFPSNNVVQPRCACAPSVSDDAAANTMSPATTTATRFIRPPTLLTSRVTEGEFYVSEVVAIEVCLIITGGHMRPDMKTILSGVALGLLAFVHGANVLGQGTGANDPTFLRRNFSPIAYVKASNPKADAKLGFG